jgi:tetratricopeptide (TPR) repeat protein
MAAHQVADAVHLTITLKEIETSLYVWSESFELRLENWFDSQRHIVRRIAMALNVHVSADRLRRFSNEPDVSLGLYDRWLRCQTLVRTFSPQHWQNLVQQFTEIINEAENFVPAYCGLVDLHNTEHIVHPGVFRSREREAKALEYARRAVQLDPIDMRAHNRMAWAHVMAKQYDLAMMHLDVACELNPNDTWMAISGALILAFCGETQRALELARLAMDLTLAPSRTHWAYHTDIQFLAGNYESAIVAADHAQNVLWGVSAWRASALAHLGRTEEAAEHAATFIATARSNWYGAEPATDESVTRWLLHMYPIRRREDWERFRDGLILAGLPCGEAKHHEW